MAALILDWLEPAYDADVITETEAVALTKWVTEQTVTDESLRIPEEFNDMLERVTLFTKTTEGSLQ